MNEMISKELLENEDLDVKEDKDEKFTNIKLNVSSSLFKKLNQISASEGIKLDDLIQELVEEAIVLRAWEVLENKEEGVSKSKFNKKYKKKTNYNPNQYAEIMDNKEKFIEYVRRSQKNDN